MAIIYQEGFECYGVAADLGFTQAVPGTWSLITDTPTGRGKALSIAAGAPSDNGWDIALPTSINEVGVSMHIRLKALPGASNRLTLIDVSHGVATTLHANIDVDTDGRVNISGDGNSSALAKTDYVLPLNEWVHLEYKVFLHPTQGVIELRVNGNVIAYLTGVKTAYVSNNNPMTQRIRVCRHVTSTQPNGAIDLDNLIVWDTTGSAGNTFLGECEIVDVQPAADATPMDWLPSSGTDGFAMLTGDPDGDTSYISAGAFDQAAVFDLADLPAGVTNVLAVCPYVIGRKDDAGAQSVGVGIVSDTAVSESLVYGLGTTYGFGRTIIVSDPNGDVPWTPASVNNLQLRLRVAQ